MAKGTLRPLSYSEILDEAFDLYKNNFLLLIGISAIICFPFVLLTSFLDSGNAKIITVFISYPVSFFTNTVLSWAISRRYLGQEATILSAIASVKSRFFPLLGTILYASLLIGLCNMLYLIPGLILFALYIFIPQTFIIEGLSYANSRRRSKELASMPHFGRIILVLICSFIITAVMFMAFRLPAFYLLTHFVKDSFAINIRNILSMTLYFSLLLSIQATVMVILYYDIRVRKEGFDVEVLAKEMGEVKLDSDKSHTALKL